MNKPVIISCRKCLKGNYDLVVEDDGSKWFVCNNKQCKDEVELP